MNLEPQSMNSGIERAALMISEEKHQQDSRKKIHQAFIVLILPSQKCLSGKIKASVTFQFIHVKSSAKNHSQFF